MHKYTGWTAIAAVAAALFSAAQSVGQTPEQEKMWEAERARALAEGKIKAEQLAQEREARSADPMAWVRTLDPMSSGGWEFRAVDNRRLLGDLQQHPSAEALRPGRDGVVATGVRRTSTRRRRSLSQRRREGPIRLQKGADPRSVGHLLHREQHSGQPANRRSRSEEHAVERDRAGHARGDEFSVGLRLASASGPLAGSEPPR